MHRAFRALGSAVVIAAIGLGATAAVAEAAYPRRPIRLVVPWPPGNSADSVARVLAERLALRLKQPVIVENRPGAAGMVGTEYVVRSTPDGYTLLVTNGAPVVLAPAVHANMNYEPPTDLAPIAMMGWVGSILVGRPSLSPDTTPELVAYLRENAARVNYASTGNTSFSRLQMEMLQRAVGVRMNHVPYKGEASQLNDLIAGHVDLAFSSVASATPLIKSGKIKGYAIGTPARSPFAPEVPTLGESGVASLASFARTGGRSWIGLLAPARLAPEIGALLHREVSHAMNDEEIRKRIASQYVVPADAMTQREFEDRIKADTANWRIVAADAGISE